MNCGLILPTLGRWFCVSFTQTNEDTQGKALCCHAKNGSIKTKFSRLGDLAIENLEVSLCTISQPLQNLEVTFKETNNSPSSIILAL